MNCREWEEPIALYASGDLDSGRALELERHLAACPGCQIYSSGMLECLDAMRAGHRREIASVHFTALRARVLDRLRPAPWWRRGWGNGWLRIAAAAVVACSAAGLAMVQRTLHQSVPPPRVALARPPAPAVAIPAAPLHAALRRRSSREAAPPAEPLTVRIVTSDPDVVIYWITNSRGE